jgi:pimeloyl-ACP methyl ester carboxylesterase
MTLNGSDPFGRAAYTDQGQGPTLLLLHGFLGDRTAWQPLMAELAGDFRCIALDLLGFGESPKPALNYTIWHQLTFVHQAIADLGLTEVHLVGHSYGGWVAAAYSLAAVGIGWQADYSGWTPEASPALEMLPPSSLTLVAPAGIRDDRFVGRYNHLRPLLWETPWVDRGLAAIAPLARLVGQSTGFDTIKRARYELMRQPVAKSFIQNRLRPEDAIDTVEAYLDQIHLPALVIAAEQDTTIPLYHCQTYAQGIPQAKLVCLKEADHRLLQTHEGAIAAELRTFLLKSRPESQP